MEIQNEASVEVKKSVQWWAKNISNASHQQIAIFMDYLEKSIYLRILNHWHLSDPSRGSGYRAIINDFHVDPLLKEACRVSNISFLNLPGQCVMILSPGVVRVRSLLNEKDEELVYLKKN